MTMWIPTQEKDRLGVVTYNFQHDGMYCLHLEVGDTVHNLCQEENWFFGYSVRNRALKGIYPKSYISIKESFIEKTAVGEQVTARQAPVVQEVTAVLREWGQIGQELYRTHDHKWRAVYLLMSDLMTSRSKMLTGTLTLDELRELKKAVTSKIDYGNNFLKLDMVVRDDTGNVLNPDSASVVKLYRLHETASQRIKKDVASSNSAQPVAGPLNPIRMKLANRHAHMFFIAVRNFVCRIGEDTELLLCLYDAREWKPLTENYVVHWSRMGLAMDLDLLGNLRVLFTDLGSRDLARERVYLVCQVVRVGHMEVKTEDNKRGTGHAGSGSSLMSGHNSRRTISGAPAGINSSNSELLRRPCGIACMDVTEYLSGRLETDEEKQHFVPFVSCSDRDSLDTTLRRLILSGREIGHKEHKNQGLWVSLRLLHGDLKQVSEEHPALVQASSVAVSRKLGFPEIILPGDVRHDLYLTLSSGEFSRGSKSADKNVEVTVRVCNERGQAIPGVMCLGSGVAPQDEYRSVVYYHEDKPRWCETFKIAIPIDEFYHSHLKFTFKHRSSNEAKDRSEKPFAMSYVKLMQDNGTTLMDTQHELLVYKLDHRKLDEETAYLSLPSRRTELTELGSTAKPSAPGLTVNNKDSLLIASCLCSTKLTQNVDLLGLLKYSHVSQSHQLSDILSALMKVDGEEVVKFLQDVLDALFNILMLNSDSNAFDKPVFDCLVFIVGLVTDRKFEHFKPVLDVYIKENFSATLAYKKLLVVLDDCVRSEVVTKGQGDELLRVMKALQYLIRFVVRSRQLYVGLHGDGGDQDFDSLLMTLLSGMADFMKSSLGPVLLAQGACLKYVPCAIPDLLLVFDDQQLSIMLADIVTSVPTGRLNNQKMMTLNDIVHSPLFQRPACRAILLPVVVRRVKEFLSGPQEVELSVTVMCDVMEILYRQDVGPTHNDVAEVMMNGLRTIIQTIISIERDDPCVGHLVSVMLSVFRQMTPHHYRNYLGHFATRSDLLDFLIEILMVFKDLVARHVYAPDWAQMVLLQNAIVLKAMRFFSQTILTRFSDPFEPQLWNNYFFCAITYVTQPALQMESFSQTKRRQILARYRDMRREMGFEIKTMWFNMGQHKIYFVPSMVGQFLEMTLLPETELRKATIPIFFDMMQCEFYSPRQAGEAYSDTKRDSSHIKGNFQGVENKLITQLDVLVEGGRGDEHYKDLFQSILTELCEKHSTMREQGLRLVRTVTRLMERLLEYRSIITDENRENRMSCTVNLLNFYNEIGRQEMYIRYLNKLCDLHLECDNFTEAAYTLQLHAQLLRWTDESLPPLLLTSRHPHLTTQRQLKEALYSDSIDYFTRGKMWECALLLCKELSRQYEEETYDYGRLSALLTRMATLYDNIIKQLRPEPEYFRVAFYGRGFPAFLQNKIFVFRGKEYEFLGDFTNRILLQFPNAEVMNKLEAPSQDIMDSPQQHLQINKVDPMLSAEDEERFASKPVSEQILRFYRVNQVQKFSFSRPFHRGQRDSENAFSSLWLERTILTTSHPLPGILRWFPVIETRVFELSPLQTAIETMELSSRQLTELILAHRSDVNLSLHPLSMKLNGIVDAAVNGGINNYEKAFFTDRYILEHPEDATLVSRLKELFALQIPLLEAALSVHRTKVNQAMQPLQQRIEVCFQQMRAHVESKYGRRDVDPQLERQMAQLMRNQQLSQRISGNSNTATSSFNAGLLSADGANSPHQRISGDAVDSPSASNTSSLTPSRMSTLSAGQSGTSHQHQSSQRQTNLFSRSTSQTLSSLSFSSLTGGSSPSSGNAISPVKMLSTGNRFRTGVKSSEKKLRDKENKQHRDSFRRLSSSSVGRGSPFPSLSLAGFSLGGSASSSGPSSPVVTGANTPVLGLSVNSLDASSSETVNGGGQETVSGTSSPTVVIELTQQLTAKRPLRSEAQRERRSSAVNRSINGDISAGGVCSSPSQNSIASTLSSSSSDDQPPPLPAKQQGNVTAPVDQNPPEKPPLPATALTEIREDSAAPSNKNYNGSTPPPPPPKHLKPARPLPPM